MWLVRDSKSYSMRDRRSTTKKNRKSFMDTIMPTYAMAHRSKTRAPMPLPGQQDSPSDAAPPPLPARRPPPATPSQASSHPVHVTRLNAAEESDEDYEEPSTVKLNMSLQEIYDDFDDLLEDFPPSSTPPLPPPPPPFAHSRTITQDSQEIYDDFEEGEPPAVPPYNPVVQQVVQQDAPQELYDDFSEDTGGDIYEDADDSGPEVKVLTPPSHAPPLPPMEGRRRGSQPPLPPVPSAKKELPPPPPVQDIYEMTEDFELDEDEPENNAPAPPPLPAGRPKPPPPQRKVEEKKAPAVPKVGLGPIGQADIQGVLKGLRKVSRDEKTEDKNNNAKKETSESLPFPVKLKKTSSEDKPKESPKENGSAFSENHHGNGNTTNSNKPIPPIKDLKPKPLIPKIPPVESNVSKAPKFPPVQTESDFSKPKEAKTPPKPGVPLKPSPTPRPPISPKTPTENGGVKTIQLTPRKNSNKFKVSSPKLPPPSPVEHFPPPPPALDLKTEDFKTEEYETEEIYDECSSQDLDPLGKFAWYHGKVERKECDKMLRNIGTDGTFLVRKSTHGYDQPYTMAVLYQDRVNNLKVRLRDDRRIALGDPKANEISFKDVEGMVQHHKKHPVLLIGRQKGEITLGESPRK